MMDDLGEGERSPLLPHMSIDEASIRKRRMLGHLPFGFATLFLVLGCLALLVSVNNDDGDSIIPIERAVEHYVEVDDGIRLWYRIWGNRQSGVPILFIHGGPGAAVVDYENGNKRFFDASDCFVVEADQRGTGRSQPSVREDLSNMELYDDISIAMISRDFEIIREHLGIEQWMVWGGSFGSTIALDYGMQFPGRSLAMILRGIYLDTVREVSSVYARDSYRHSRKRLQEFDVLYELANNFQHKNSDSDLDPNDALGLMQVYETMIREGRKDAIWNWFVFENNLMEERQEKLLNPSKIDESLMPEAQSMAFFETRLWIHASLEEPSNLIERVDQLADTPIWICQGVRDEVCPSENARFLVEELQQVGAPYTAHFINAGHEDTDPVMERCLKRSVDEFKSTITTY